MTGPGPSDPTLPGGNPAVQTTKSPPGRPYPFLSPPHTADELGRLGGYRVLRLLGTGGMGYVFEAEELALRRRVALKVLKPELAADPDNRERFLREARAAAAIESDHAVTIFHVADDEPPYLTMQFLEGETLQSRIERPGRLTLRTALEVARQAAKGLAAAHENGLVHRDIKPANLWLERKDATKADQPAEADSASGVPPAPFRVRILDFGLARRSTEPSLTSTGFIVGTPNFMAPEQASGMVVDGRADLFSLGCVLYTMLTGELPFPGNSAMAVMMALANRTPPRVNQKAPAIPEPVADLVAGLLEKNPDRRPRTAREVAAKLADLLAGGVADAPLPAPPPRPAGEDTMPRGTGDTWSPGPAVPWDGGGDQVSPPAPREAPESVGTRRARRRSAWVWAVLGVALIAAAVIGLRGAFRSPESLAPEPVVVGVLHSQTGAMAVSEEPVRDATLLAIEEVNAAGGVLGRPIRAVVADGRSDPATFAAEASRLLGDHRAAALFGCWTSASRKAVLPALDFHRGLLFYPVQSEGLEQHPRVIYLGPAPNQQLLPALDFLTGPVAEGKLGKKQLFFIGSDYVFPQAALEIVKERVKELPGVEIVGESFVPLRATDQEVFKAVAAIGRANPDAVLNALNGSANFPFFGRLREGNLVPDELPVVSVSISEVEARGLRPKDAPVGQVVASYFQTVDTPASREFARKFRERFGPERVVSDMAAAAYEGVHLWARAAEKAGTTDPDAVLAAARGLEFDGPRGRVKIDPENQYAWLPVRVGRVRGDGLIDVLPGLGSETPIRPKPFPDTRTPAEWNGFLTGLKGKWFGHWEAPPSATGKN